MTVDLLTALNAELTPERDPPPVIYHYTKQSGLIGIVDEQKLRATHIKFVNDEKEYNYALGILADYLSDDAYLSQFGDVRELVNVWKSALTVTSEFPNYLISF